MTGKLVLGITFIRMAAGLDISQALANRAIGYQDRVEETVLGATGE
jgi:hypothetical protein